LISASKTTFNYYNLKILRPKGTKNIKNFCKKFCEFPPRAFVESGDEPQPITLDLFDNGSGSDLIANDGIYSRFFVKYDGKNGDYTLRCQV